MRLIKSLVCVASATTWVSMASFAQCPPDPTCDTDPGADVAFEVTVEYYDWNPFGGTGPTVATYGPTVGGISAPERNEVTGAESQVSSVSGGASGGSFWAEMFNDARAIAQPIDGHIFGNGIRVRVRVYMQGDPGDPYQIIRSASGLLNTAFPQGAGRSDSWFGSQAASSVNGGAADEERIGSDLDSDGTVEDHEFVMEVLTGTLSSETLRGAPEYRFAREVLFDTHGGMWQSIFFCFPSCSTHVYYATGQVSIGLDARLGSSQCVGTLTLKREGCEIPPLREPFEIIARFLGNGTDIFCSCCEYQQFVRRREVYRRVLGVEKKVDTPRGGADPCNAGEPKNGCCPVEDTVCDDDGCVVALGPRSEPCPYPYSTYYDIDHDYTFGDLGNPGGCVFRGIDRPGWSNVALPGEYRYKADFIGRIVSTCTGEVVAERRWTVDCGRQTFPLDSGGDGPAPTVSTYFDIGTRKASIIVTADGDHVFGTLSYYALEGESPTTDDASVALVGAVPDVLPEGPLPSFGSTLGEFWVVPFGGTFSKGVPPTVSAMVDVVGEALVVDIDLSPGCPEDLDATGDVGFGDILAVIGAWGPCGVPCPEDLNGNGQVDFADILEVIGAWGPCRGLP